MKSKIVKALRRSYRLLARPKFEGLDWCTNEERVYANRIIHDLLVDNKPVFIGRIGTTEQGTVLNYMCINAKRPTYLKIKDYITNNTRLPWWESNVIYNISTLSGFFPPNNISLLNRFCELYLQDIPQMDVCGRYHYWENFMPLNQKVISVQLETLYPFFVERPWTSALKGKKVLVVHPFVSTIESQYLKRQSLFNNEDILPDFELKTVQAVQSIAGAEVPFNDWFEALEFMKIKISETDFDVCILGCGAYGLPLGAFVKRLGKKAIHMGGGAQLLFGIKGKRWELDYVNSCYRDMFNEYWVYPSASEKPVGADKVEGACYW